MPQVRQAVGVINRSCNIKRFHKKKDYLNIGQQKQKLKFTNIRLEKTGWLYQEVFRQATQKLFVNSFMPIYNFLLSDAAEKDSFYV
jgi:hypothetical protein